MVANGSLAADHLSASIDGAAIASESAEDPEMTFSLSAMEISALPMVLIHQKAWLRSGTVRYPSH